MRVLVTGGTGYLGRAIVSRLAARGHEPVVFARRAREAALPGDAVDGDICDAAAVARAVGGCEAVIHAAALVSIWQPDPARFDAVNVGGLRHVLEAARAHGVRRLVYTSSFLALPPAGRQTPLLANDYQRTKAAGLALARSARDSGLPLVIVVPGVVYGPGVRSEGNLVARLLADHRAGRLPGIVGGSRVWSFAFVDDVAEGHVTALERGAPGAEYGLGGENVPQRRLFEWLRDVEGRPLPRELPPTLAGAAGLLEEWRARLTGRTPLITRGAVTIFRHDWPVDSARAMADLGYRATPLAEGLAATLAALDQAEGGRRP
jgi:nucleoside-diphosphate-sugar epimerase